MEPVRRLNIPLQERTLGRLLERKAAENGDKTLLHFEDQTFSYRDTDRIANRLANGLLALGTKRGDHVALMMDNSPETLFVNFALGKIGAAAAPVNTAAKGDLLVYFLTFSDVTTLIVDAALLERFIEIADRIETLARIVVVGPATAPAIAGRQVATYAELMAHADTPPPVEVSIDDTIALLFTSGTTGQSKAIVSPHRASLYFAIGRAEFLGFLPDDVVYTCLPLFHGNALYAACVPAMLADASIVLARRFSASRFWDDVRRYGVTQFNLLSSMTNILWGQAPHPLDGENKVRQCTMVPVPVFAHEFEHRFNLKITSSFALSDFGQVSFLQPGHPPEKFRSAGLPRPGVSISIQDDDDNILPPDEPGEICVRNDDPAYGRRHYYKMPELNEQSRRNGWFHTGDRGYLDADGYLYFVDRKKDAIRRRGENISSWEVEQAILRHPAVAEVAVFPVKSEMSEDEVMASVVCHAGQSLDPVELVRFCEKNMSYFMVPRFIDFPKDLPRTATEKVQKRFLREQAEKRLHQVWDREKAGIALLR
ncbi:MAG: AMP-binding protein [Reyranellaceae bacterium]